MNLAPTNTIINIIYYNLNAFSYDFNKSIAVSQMSVGCGTKWIIFCMEVIVAFIFTASKMVI